MGWYDNVNDRVSIYLPNINDAAQMKRIMLHEVVGHKGLHDLFGLHTADFMEEVYEKADNDVRDKIKEIQKQFEYRDPYTAVEEYLATLNEKVNLTPKERTLLEGFKDFVREMLVRLNLYGEKKVLNEQDLVDIMQKHYESVLRRSSAGSHRRQAFGGFRNARYGEKSYTDLETNIRHFKKRNKDLNFENVDEFFRDTKKKELGQLNFRFIGERGLENLNYSGNRNYDDLKIAKQLETNGVDADYIRQKTGWERGWDNKWRYEISENSMFVKDPLRALNDEYTPNGTVSGDVAVPLADRLADYKAKYNLSPDRNPLRLRHLVDDDVFFGAYPELAYIRIEPRSGERGICRYDAKQRILYFDDSKIHTNEFRGELAGCMQRMIQDYEDFARAFDLHDSEVKPSYHDALKKVEELRRYKHIPNFEREHEYMQKEFIEEFGVPYHAFEGVFPSENEYNIYKETDNIKSLTGWDEVRNVKRRMSYKDSDRRNTPAWTTEDYEFDEQIPAVNFEDIEAKLDGPIDRLMRILKRNDTDKMMYFQKRISLDYVDPRLSPGQENRYKQYMREWINDNYRRNSREYRDGLREHRYEYEIDPEGFLNKN